VSARSNSGSATSASSRTESAVADVNVELVEVTSGNSVINEVRDGGRVRASEKAVARDEFNRGWMDGDKAPSKEQLANRRRRMRYRRNKRAQSMADTHAARGFTKLIRMYQKQKRPWKIMEGICAARAGPPEDNILNCINYNAALNALVELGDIDSAKAVFQWIEEDVGPDVVALSSMIKAFGKADAIDEAFALLDDYEERTRSTAPRRVYMNLLNACAYVGDVQRSRAMMHRIKIMEGVEVQRTREKLRNFNQYAGGDASPEASNSGDGSEGENAGEGSTRHRFKLGSFDLQSKLLQYNLLIKAYCNSATPLGGWAVLTDMRRSGVPPDRVTFNQLMVGAALAGSEAGADMGEQVMEYMKGLAVATQDTALLPDSITYSNALKAAAYGPRALETVQAIVNEIDNGFEVTMSEQNYFHRFRPDAECCATIVEVLCELGQPETALSYMDKWQMKGRSARPRGILAVMRAYCGKGDLDAVKYLHARFVRQELSGKISGKLLYEANLLVAEARKTAYRRRSAFSAAVTAEAQSEAWRKTGTSMNESSGWV